MQGISDRIFQNLTQAVKAENELLPQWVDKKFVAGCLLPPLSGEHNVHCNVAVVAPVSAGKSTLFNALCGYPILPVASKTTSSVPTYISRIREQSQESITVYSLRKETKKSGNLTSTQFKRDLSTRRAYSARDISREMFNDLFDYMYYITHGVNLKDNQYEYMTTVENVSYFMKSVDRADILFNGMDSEKWSISKDDFALIYENPRHRLLLLLILLCVYVNQNDREEEMDAYTKQVNLKRRALLSKYNFPADGDYCVCLDWCSDDIPENVTLIDLPGTGASTQDTAKQSSHTAIVRGILSEADAIWVLCSDNGAVDADLIYALNNVIEGNSRKNKVCIYNCKNNNPNNSGPVTDFLKKLPCLTGERCYVVDALAGEYKYIQNGVNALMTKNASDKRSSDDDEFSEKTMIRRLETLYSGQKRSYCTFTTGRDSMDNIVAVQDSSLRYTLDAFFKSALADYIERLRYEVVLMDTIRQAKSYLYIRDSLYASRGILEGINGKGEQIAGTVSKALDTARDQAFDDYVSRTAAAQAALATQLSTLSETIGTRIEARFTLGLDTMIEDIKEEWRNLVREDHPNCMEKNRWGNYSLRETHSNWEKFSRVRSITADKVAISSFSQGLAVVTEEIQKYGTLLKQYVADLKKVTYDFKSDYIRAFLESFDRERDEICRAEGSNVTQTLYENFNSTREKLKQALESKLDATCVMLCDSFDELTQYGGIFDTLCEETDRTFRDGFCENILDPFRDFMSNTFLGANYISWFRDCMRPQDLRKILEDDFGEKKKLYTESLSRLIGGIFGAQLPGYETVNFPNDLAHRMTLFSSDKIANGAVPQIETMHSSILSLVGFGASIVVDLEPMIRELDQAIRTWEETGKGYQAIGEILEDSDAENTKRLYEDCRSQIGKIAPASQE